MVLYIEKYVGKNICQIFFSNILFFFGLDMKDINYRE